MKKKVLLYDFKLWNYKGDRFAAILEDEMFKTVKVVKISEKTNDEVIYTLQCDDAGTILTLANRCGYSAIKIYFFVHHKLL